MQVKLAEEGRVVFEATADESHTNPLGGVHGGFAATVMDSVTGCSATPHWARAKATAPSN
ncbi:PaaI family thioesterase [Halopseudomonas pachastrellae]|nr:PaaI family thioesterase [Halopseudomonas pachastrellae]